MSIKLAIAGSAPIKVSDENIMLGSDPSCPVSLPDSTGALPKHAVIRKIAGRWMIEVRDGESVYVGSDEPKRLFWLNPGDTIRLTEDGPPIVFEPPDDAPSDSDFLPMPAASEVILPPDSSPSIPAKQAKSSASIRTPKPPSSGSIKTPKSSQTIRTVNSDGAKQRKSSADMAATSEPLKRRSGQIKVPLEDDEPVSDVPTLQRLSSWDEEDPTQRRGLTEEQAEMKWIMNVITRAVGAGLVLLVVWLVVSWIMKSMNPSSIDSLAPASTSPSSIEQPIVPAEPTPQVSKPASFGTELNNSKATVDRPVKKPAPQKEPAATDDEPKDSKSDDPAPEKPKRNPRQKPPMNEEETPAPSTDNAATSPLMKVKDSLYAVIVEDTDKSKQIQVGTAWASSKRFLVTSATVVAAVEEYRQQGMIVSVMNAVTGQAVRIKSTRMHDTYRKAVEGAEEALEQRDTTRLATERANQVRYDLGVLDVGRNEKLPKKISSLTEPLDDSKDKVFHVVGVPFQDKDAPETVAVDEKSIKERRCRKPSPGTSPQNKDMELTIQFIPDPKGLNWSGSPVLNEDNKVIGIYSQLRATSTSTGKPVKPEFGVSWIGRLPEFASDAE